MLFVKRVFDLIVSGVLLILLSPLFLVVAVMIKLTTPKMSVFYPWRVVGQNGVEFTGYKFTTMQADADERKAELETHNEMTGPVFKMKNDPRMTPLGRFLVTTQPCLCEAGSCSSCRSNPLLGGDCFG